MSSRLSHLVCAAAAGGLLMLATSVAHAQPASDDLASATIIQSPFSGVADVSAATTAADEPVPSCMVPGGFGGNSVWYRYTPGVQAELRADTFGSNYDTVLVVWDGGPTGSEAGCNDDSIGLQSAVTFTALAGHTYYFQIASWREYDPAFDPAPVLVFNLAAPPPPFSATVTMDAIGRASGATGVIEISGTVTCNRHGTIDAMVHVQQQHGRIAAAGVLLSGPCGPVPQRATGRFVGQNARFTPGQATLTVVGNASENPFSSAAFSSVTAVRLQGVGPKDLALPPPPAP